MRKKVLAMLLAVVMAAGLLPGTAFAAGVSGTCGDNVTWSYEDGVLTIQGTGPMKGLPDGGLYTGNPAPWYAYSGQIRTVRIGYGVTTIGNAMFAYCENLVSVEIPGSVTSIGWEAFRDCTSLAAVNIPEGVESIGYEAFRNCTSLTSVVIPEGVEVIRDATFYSCTSLASVTIPVSVTTIGWEAFKFCNALDDVYYNGGKTQWYRVFIDCYNEPLTNASFHPGDDSDSPGSGTPDAPETPQAPTLTTEGLVSSNNAGHSYDRWAAPIRSYLYENQNGGLTRVEYVPAVLERSYSNGQWISTEISAAYIAVENYSSGFEFQDGWSVPMELDIWGGFFAGKDCNFLVFGRENPEENNHQEVIRVVKYSRDWQRLGQASLFGANTTVPFDAGTLRFAEYGGELYIRTCHEMYTSSDGLNHQSNLTMAVRESDMKILDTNYSVLNSSVGYVSHSFNQFVLVDRQQRIVTLDHGDAYPRSAVLMVYDTKAGQGLFSGPVSSATIQSFPGAIGANATGASLGGLAETGSGYVVAYNYDGQGYSDSDLDRSVYLAYVDKNSLSVTTKAISGAGTTTPVLVPTGLDGGYILWNACDDAGRPADTLFYAAYSADGKVGEVKTAAALLSDCQPVVYDGKIVWYVTNNSSPVFYTLDENGVTAIPTASEEPTEPDPTEPEEPATSDKCGENLTWSYSDGVLTIQGTGPMADYEYGDHMVGNMPWYDRLEEIRTVIIGDDVTSIGDMAFAFCHKLTDVTIPGSVTSIGVWAFYECSSLTSVVIPDGVTTIPNRAFSGCNALASVTIPASVTTIESYAFQIASGNLTDVYYGGSESQWDQIDKGNMNWPLVYATVHFNADPAGPEEPEKPTEPAEPEPETPAITFTDVPANAYYAAAVTWAVDGGIVNGTGNYQFRPTRTCSEGEILTMLYRASGETAATTAPLTVASWYQDAVNWAYEKKMIDSSFDSDNPCTRASAVYYIWLASGKESAKTSSFTDVEADADYAMAVSWAVEKKITTGTNAAGTTFSPYRTCMREEIVTLLYRAYAN